MSVDPGERRDLVRQARRRRVQRAARKVFSARGFLGATMEDVAREAHISVGAIYLHFKSKEELYVSLLNEAFEMLAREFTRIAALPADPRARMAEVWGSLVRFNEKHPESYRVILFFNNPGIQNWVSAEVLREVNRAAGRDFSICAGILDDGVKRGVYRPHDSRAAAELIWSLFMGIVQLHEARRNLGLATRPIADVAREAWLVVEHGLVPR